MSSVDSRIVTMKFDNAQFQSGAATTLSTLEKLKQGMNMSSATSTAAKGLTGISGILAKFGIKNPFASTTQGLSDVSKAAQTTAGPSGLGVMTGAVTGISKTFVAMSTIAVTALSHVTTAAIQSGTQMVKSLTIDPLTGGLKEYETNLNSIQTILANTKVSGANLQDVNKALQELNHYSDKTIYNFSEMAKNIGTFTAAGVDLDTATASIKGIANLAALSGSNSQQAASAMYQLSQEIAAGRVSLMGWNSVVNAGMGGATFQRALVTTAINMGTLNKNAVEFVGKMKNAKISGQSFRDSIMAKPGEVSWLSSKVLTNTLEQFTGDMTKAQLAAQGFNEQQIKFIQSQAKTAVDAATKVKTLTGVIDTAREVAGSGWAKTWQLIFGDFKEARTLFTNVSNRVNSFINSMSNARNELLEGWKDAGGRALLIENLGKVFSALGDILGAVGDAFREVFPPTTVNTLMSMTEAVGSFADAIQPGAETLENLKRTFAGFFAILHIGWTILKQIVSTIFDLGGAAAEGGGGILEFTAGIGDFLVALDKAISSGEGLGQVFGTIGTILEIPIRLLQALGGLLAGIFSGFDSGAGEDAADTLGKLGDAMTPLEAITERLNQLFGGLGDVLANVGHAIGEALADLGQALADSFSGGDFSPVLDVINTGLLGAITLMLKKFFSNGLNFNLFSGGGLMNSISGPFDELTGVMKAMQTQIKADALMKIAIAIGVLTASVVALSLIDSAKLTKALVAMSVGFGQLLAAMAIIEQVGTFVTGAKFTVIAAGFIALATSILILSAAVALLAQLNWEELAKGLIGTTVLIGALAAASIPLSANAGGMIRAGAGIAAMSVGILILAGAVKIFSMLSWDEMIKGMVGMAGALILVAGAAMLISRTSGPALLAIGPGLIAFATGISILAGAMKLFGMMDWGEIAKGLVAMAGALLIVAGAVALIPGSIVFIGPGLIAVAVAMTIMAGAFKIMGSMGWEEIAKAMVVLAASLAILAAGLTAMIAALPGAAALLVAAAALAVLTPVLVTLGSLSIGTIVQGLAALAAIFIVFGAAAALMAPIIPAMIGLGIAMLALGAGLALAGVGLLAVAAAVGILAAAWAGGQAIIMGAISSLLQMLPQVGTALAKMMVSFANAIAKQAPKFGQAMVAVLKTLLKAVIQVTPQVGRALNVLINTGLRVLVNAVPRYVTAGIQIVTGVLRGMANNVGKVVNQATRLIVNFINAIARNLPKVIQAGVNMVIKFINGVADAIDRNSERMGQAGARLGIAIVRGMIDGVRSMVGELMGEVRNLAESAYEEAKDFLHIGSPSKKFLYLGTHSVMGFAEGLRDKRGTVANEAGRLGDGAIKSMNDALRGVSDGIRLDPDMRPTIAPVLDLSGVTKDAKKIDSLVGGAAPIDTSLSYAAAASIANDVAATNEAMAAGSVSGETKFELTQNNYSPKAISAVETYRGTKSLLELAKGELGA